MFILKSIASIIFNVAIFAVLLFLPAATLDWWRAWLFIGVVFIGMVGGVVSLSRDHEDALKERLKPPIQKGQPLADKIIVVLFLAAFYGLVIFIPLDVFRFHLMGNPERSFRLWGLHWRSRVGGPPTSPLGRTPSRRWR